MSEYDEIALTYGERKIVALLEQILMVLEHFEQYGIGTWEHRG